MIDAAKTKNNKLTNDRYSSWSFGRRSVTRNQDINYDNPEMVEKGNRQVTHLEEKWTIEDINMPYNNILNSYTHECR
uniref:Uncharacterized protein n=1 Tax=Romanomermis culicivorax TaxID=13658 RepID=A0A915K7T9_ROMCU